MQLHHTWEAETSNEIAINFEKSQDFEDAVRYNAIATLVSLGQGVLCQKTPENRLLLLTADIVCNKLQRDSETYALRRTNITPYEIRFAKHLMLPVDSNLLIPDSVLTVQTTVLLVQFCPLKHLP